MSVQSSRKNRELEEANRHERLVPENRVKNAVDEVCQLKAEWDYLRGLSIQFVDHPIFRKLRADSLIEELRPESLDLPSVPIRDISTEMLLLPALAQHSLLTGDEEHYLFCRMNYLKFRAERSRKSLVRGRPTAAAVAAIRSDLQEANNIRNLIAERNLRLLVALAKKLSSSPQQMVEMVGESFAPLLRAVELFDISMGNRFSTYATWAARNQMLRTMKRQQLVPVTTAEDDSLWEKVIDHRRQDTGPIDEAGPVQSVLELIRLLDDRERLVICARFGLQGESSGQSLAEISTKVGLSKERVRQICIAALEKLRGFSSADEIVLS